MKEKPQGSKLKLEEANWANTARSLNVFTVELVILLPGIYTKETTQNKNREKGTTFSLPCLPALGLYLKNCISEPSGKNVALRPLTSLKCSVPCLTGFTINQAFSAYFSLQAGRSKAP